MNGNGSSQKLLMRDSIQRPKTEIQKFSPERHQQMREEFYKAVEGMWSLSAATELADVELGCEAILLDEHLKVAAALEEFKKVTLGKVL